MASLHEFINTVTDHKGLNSATISELVFIAPKLTDEERTKTLDDLLPLNNQLHESKNGIMKLYQKAKQILQRIQRQYTPGIRKIRELNEHAEEMKRVENIFE